MRAICLHMCIQPEQSVFPSACFHLPSRQCRSMKKQLVWAPMPVDLGYSSSSSSNSSIILYVPWTHRWAERQMWLQVEPIGASDGAFFGDVRVSHFCSDSFQRLHLTTAVPVAIETKHANTSPRATGGSSRMQAWVTHSVASSMMCLLKVSAATNNLSG